MHRGVVIAALCVGCYAPSYSPGTPCETECPGNLVCIDRVCREPGYTPTDDAPLTDTTMATVDAPIDGPTIDGPPGDVDADGVLDNVDNCPALSNVDQHDEDADARGDVCDFCPHIAGSQIDSDGDKVGDACDPQMNVAKERIAFFDPFTTTRSEWLYQSNTTRVGETLRIVGGSNAGAARVAIATSATRTYTGGTIAAVPATTPHQLSMSYGHNTGGDVYHYVEFYDSSGSTGGVTITERNIDSYTELSEINYSGALPTGAWSMRVDESVAAQTFGLFAKLGGVDYGPQNAVNVGAPPLHVAGSYIHLYVRNADIRFDYFLVIETLP